MCILFLKYSPSRSGSYRLILASNRDEFYERPTAPAHFWPEYPHILAGQDKLNGGTWLGITRNGRFATLTNYRKDPSDTFVGKSRGTLVLDYLTDTTRTASEYCHSIRSKSHEYDGYNILAGQLLGDSDDELVYYTNRGEGEVMSLSEGIYGLSNSSLDVPWLKLSNGKEKFRSVVDNPSPDKEVLTSQLMEILNDKECYHPDPNVHNTGFPEEWLKAFNSIFVRKEDAKYGTRTNTVLLVDGEGSACYTERTMEEPINAKDPSWRTTRFDFKIQFSNKL